MTTAKILVVMAGLTIGGVAVAGGPETTDSNRAYAAEMKADAALRTSNLNGSNSGLILADGGDTSVKLGGFAQFRYINNFRDNPPNATSGSFHDSGYTNGFEATRTRLEVTGNIISKALTFKVDSDFNKSGDASLKDAWGQYAFDNGVKVKWGQFKLPVLREELVADVNQLAIDRSIVNTIFTQDRSQGIQAAYEQDQWRILGALSDGLQTLNTDYTSSAEADYAFSGRGEFKWGDDWKRFADFTSWRGQSNAGLIGVAAHYQHSGNTASAGNNAEKVDLIQYPADFSLEGNGWNLFVAGVGRHSEPSGTNTASTLDDFGFVVQGGVFVNDQIELFARYDGVFVDSDYGNGIDDTFNTLAGGVNYYVFAQSQAFKISADVQYFVDEVSSNVLVSGVSGSNNNALRFDGEGGQFAVRLQVQLVF